MPPVQNIAIRVFFINVWTYSGNSRMFFGVGGVLESTDGSFVIISGVDDEGIWVFQNIIPISRLNIRTNQCTGLTSFLPIGQFPFLT